MYYAEYGSFAVGQPYIDYNTNFLSQLGSYIQDPNQNTQKNFIYRMFAPSGSSRPLEMHAVGIITGAFNYLNNDNGKGPNGICYIYYESTGNMSKYINYPWTGTQGGYQQVQ